MRRHTAAFAAASMSKQVHPFMLEVGAMDDVGHAYDRCLGAGSVWGHRLRATLPSGGA